MELRRPLPDFDDAGGAAAPPRAARTVQRPALDRAGRQPMGSPWRLLPNDFPPWPAVYQQTQRWIRAGCFEAIVHDLRALLRVAQGRQPHPSAAIFDSRTVQSTRESGARAGYDGYKRRNGSKAHMAVDTLGHLLALVVTAANEQDRAQVEALASAVQQALARRCTWRTWIKRIRAKTPPRRPSIMASDWRW